MEGKSRGDHSDASPICGGALVTERHVLTVAHCVMDERFVYFVQAGSNLNDVSMGIIVEVGRVEIHPRFEEFTFESDVAVLFLKEVVRIM